MTDSLLAGSPASADRLPFLTLPNWVRAAARCGLNVERVFRDAGVQTDLIHLESATVSIDTLRLLMEGSVAQSGDGLYFPFVLGETFAFEYVPDVETFLTTSPNLREAFRVFEWIRLLINPLMNVALHEAGDEARMLVSFDVGATTDAAHQHFLEATFSAIVRFVRGLMRGEIGEVCLTFRAARPDNAIDYEGYFKMPVHFGAVDDALVFRRALLEVPLNGAFPALHRQAEYRVEQRLAQSATARPGLVAHIEQIFTESPALLGQGIEVMAQRLQLHPRTLQRRLQEVGVRYTALQAQVRFRLSSQWLQDDGVSIEAISERLGFCDRRSFTQAFKRWSGLSPSQFRGKPRSG
ncbi:AraC family transcriptional regulator ligand-binding domain-containing protein [Aquabacterium sp.]|uniref:AraC family transcriptional regulator n=1 Tax=Aquabacterium sp. TaxID=1872578 RepID=UPI0035AF03E5